MPKKTKQATVKYEQHFNNIHNNEGYVIEIEDYNGQMVFESFFSLKKLDADLEANYLHWSFIRKMKELQAYGYEIKF